MEENKNENTGFESKINEVLNTADTTQDFDPEDINTNKVMAILCYLGILIVVPFISAKDSKFVKYHLNQGLILLLLGIAIGIVGCIPVVGSILNGVGGLVCLILMVIGILNAARGEAKELPVIGRYTIYK